MNQYLLFDLDGTLTDPKLGITTCVQYALHSLGIEEEDRDKLEPFIGPPLKDSFMDFYQLDEARAEAAIEKYRERFKDRGMFENEVYPGIRRMLYRLKKNGAVLAVASSKPEVFVKKILEHFHLTGYFDVIVGSELDGRRVAKEEVVQEALRRLFPGGDMDYDNIVMIGDRKFDVFGAKDNKVVSVAVSYGYGSMEELKEAKPDYIARSVRELEALLMRGRRKGREKAVVNWHKPGIGTKTWKIFFPILFYFVVSDVLRMLVLILVQNSASILPRQVIRYDEAGRMAGLTGDVSAVVNVFLFLAVFLILYFLMGRSDLIQEKFAFQIRNANERRGAGICSRFVQGKKRLLLVLMEGIFLACLGAGVATGCNFLFSLTGLTQVSSAFRQVSEQQMTAGLLIGLLLYGVISPMTEELIFRGIVFTRLKRYFSLTVSVVLSSLVFGIYHGNVVQALYGFLAGCLFAWLYHKSGSFGWTVALHGFFNITGFCLSYYRVFESPLYGWQGCIAAFLLAALSLLAVGKVERIKAE